MKYVLFVWFSFFTIQSFAQIGNVKKPHTVGLHVFYNDIATAQQIKTTSLNNVLTNKLWTAPVNMQVGLGLDYRKGITKKIDVVATIDGSYIDYLFQNGTYNGSTKFLFAAQTGVNIKLLTDKHPVVPYITAGAGFSLYDGKSGFYIPLGVGLQFYVFNEVFIFSDAQYRHAISSDVNDHFNYSVGMATPLRKNKKTVIKEQPTLPEITAPLETKKIINNIVVQVTDEATGQPLPYVSITLDGPEGKKLAGTTDANGKVSFNEMPAANYTANGILNNINTTTKNIAASDFIAQGNDIVVNVTHNDPRFTLAGNVVNKATNKPESNVDVTATNITQNSKNTQQSKLGDGSFSIQLEANSDFSIVGKKASFLSNIEKASTKGLNRSTTLYLKLELNVQEVTASKNIVLNNINFESGKINFNVISSTDLNKLIQFLKDNPSLKLEIQGHTDNVGTATGNTKLSQARANNIVKYLVEKGIESNRLLAKGYGSTKPLASNTTAAGKAQNRRVEMKLIQ